MKKLFMFVFVLVVFLATLGATEIKALSSTDTVVAKAPAKRTLNQPVNDTLRVVPFQGKYLIYSTKAKMVFKNDSLRINIIGSLDYISPLIPQRYWAKAYESKKLEIGRTIRTLAKAEKNGLPIMKRTVVSDQAIVIGKNMFFQSVTQPEEMLIGFTWLFFGLLYLVGLAASGLVILVFSPKIFQNLFSIIVVIMISLMGFTYGGWGVLFSGLFAALGEITGHVIDKLFIKKVER